MLVFFVMMFIVFIIFFGVSLLISLYRIVPSEDATAVSLLAAAVFGRSSTMFYVTQVMTVVILSLAANTAFADLPLLMSLIAGHGYLPKQLVNRGSRLNFSNGILFLFGMASLLVFVFRGSQHLLLPLYASGVFISFFLSQFGMFTHWRRQKGPHWKFKAAVNGFGSVLTGSVLIIIVIMKFMRGAWVALLLITLFILIMLRIKRHYERVSDDLTISSVEKALAEINREKTARVIIPVQSLNKSFIKTLNCALSCGFSSMELYSVCSTEEQALRIREQIEALGVGCEFRYDVTTLRNTSEILLAHIRQEAEASDKERLIVMMGGLVVTSPFARILHNSTTHRLMRRMETYRNVYVFSVPYVIE